MRATSAELGGATWFGDAGSSLIDYVWAPTELLLRCSGPLRKLAAELQLIGTRLSRDLPLGLEFDDVQLAGQPAPGEKEAWNADALMEGVGRGDFWAALEDRVKSEDTQWAPLLQLHLLVGRLPQQSFGRDGAAILQERTSGCSRLCRLGSEKAGASQESVGGQEEHRRGSSPGAGGHGTFGGASAEGPHRRGTAGVHISIP